MTENADTLATDAQLLQRCRNRDQSAFGQIVERYQSLVCSVAYNRCGDLAMSEDLAQEAFVIAWQKLDDLTEVAKFKSWICTIVRNLANRSCQRAERSIAGSAMQLESAGDLRSMSETPIQQAVSAEEQQLVWQALADIPENYREPMILFYREEQSVARVAEALELSQVTVKQRLSRGRKMLQEHLAGTVESALSKSKPAKAFTATVVIGLFGANAKPAAATGLSSAAKAAGTAFPQGGFGAAFLGHAMQLPIIAWMLKTALDETRSERERSLMLRHLLVWTAAVVLFAILAFASMPWVNRAQPPLLRGLAIPGMLVLFYVPLVVSSRRLGKQLERLRIEEGTATKPQPIIKSVDGQPSVHGTTWLCCLSGMAVMIWPAALAFFLRDWGLAAMLFVVALAVNFVSAQFCVRLPKRSFQAFVVGLAITAWIGIGAMWWRRPVWNVETSNFLGWFSVALQSQAATFGVLAILVWRRVYGKSQNDSKNRKSPQSFDEL